MEGNLKVKLLFQKKKKKIKDATKIYHCSRQKESIIIFCNWSYLRMRENFLMK